MLLLAIGLALFFSVKSQPNFAIVDSIRIQYHIPEIGYAVVSSNQIIEIATIGATKINTNRKAQLSDRFRIGSNTKAITGFIAARLVKEKKINWNTRFFDLFPELKATSNKAFLHLTLFDLLTFRTRLFPYTYTYNEPTQDQFSGDEAQQRYHFAEWFFHQSPVKGKGRIHFSNLGYVAAGLMLEKVSGKSYQTLVREFGKELNVSFGFGPPNVMDSLQPWGHNKDLLPEEPSNNFKLNWLLAAGNINVSLPDYCKFIQLQLAGLKGESSVLTQAEFNFLHFGRKTFSVGWFSDKDEKDGWYSYNIGNPGTFLSKVFVFKQQDRAYILVANSQSESTDKGLTLLYEALKAKYNQ